MTRDDIKAALLKVYPEADGPEFDALLAQIDGNDRGVYDSLPGSVSDTRKQGRGGSANGHRALDIQKPTGG